MVVVEIERVAVYTRVVSIWPSVFCIDVKIYVITILMAVTVTLRFRLVTENPLGRK